MVRSAGGAHGLGQTRQSKLLLLKLGLKTLLIRLIHSSPLRGLRYNTGMTNTKPVVSVVMSVYNAENFLGESITSVLKQTFTDFEFIIIEDGSTDGSRQIIEGVRDPRIRLLKQANKGLAEALNRG